MIFCIDVGNTHTVLCLTDTDNIIHDWRIRTDSRITADELYVTIFTLFKIAKLSSDSVSAIVVSSVVPPVTNIIKELAVNYFNISPVIANSSTDIGMPIKCINPATVGADRIVNAAGAYEKYHTSMIIIDFGTATTFDCVSINGEFMGGVIAPGAVIASEALFNSTSQLPKVNIFTPPKDIIAQDTVNSIKAGILYGYTGLVDGIVKRMKKEMDSDPMVIATGGLAHIFSDLSETINTVEKFLTIHGLMTIFKKISQSHNPLKDPPG